MSKRRNCCSCCNNVANSNGFGNICNPFCLIVLLLALKKSGIIEDQCTIEALFFIFLLLCCCNCNNTGVAGCRRAYRCC